MCLCVYLVIIRIDVITTRVSSIIYIGECLCVSVCIWL